MANVAVERDEIRNENGFCQGFCIAFTDSAWN